MEVLIERMVPERLLSWRWHPAAIDPAVDYSEEPTTLVVFELAGRRGRHVAHAWSNPVSTKSRRRAARRYFA